MARMRIEGMDEVIEDMIRMGQQTGPVADKMLLAGAQIVRDSWKAAINAYEFVDKGEMFRSVGYPKKPKTINDVRTLPVYPLGKDEDGVRNAEKAFILHYGRNNMPASHFVDEAEKNAADMAEMAMTKVWNEFIEGRFH